MNNFLHKSWNFLKVVCLIVPDKFVCKISFGDNYLAVISCIITMNDKCFILCNSLLMTAQIM